jgi:hypothetical protein
MDWAKKTLWGHRHDGRVVNITLEELIEKAEKTKICPICEAQIDWAPLKGRFNNNSPSWDRKFNGNRLSANNTWIICRKCNVIKSDAPMPEFVAYCKMVADKFGGEYL